MPAWLTGLLPAEGIKIVLVLFLSFIIGLEREEHLAGFKGGDRYGFGGVRTFPLLGLIGYAANLISNGSLLFPSVGLAVVGSFLWLSYQHKLSDLQTAGATTEISGLAVYLIGVLVSRGAFWIATTIAVLSVLLLELKGALENLSNKVPGPEILAFAKFLLLTAVILPIVPDRIFGPFGFNPFKAWLVVVAASGVSYGSYLLQKANRDRGGVFVSAVLGGAYSSTVTTVILAKRARETHAPRIFAGAILAASGVMYLRLLVLVALFNRDLAVTLLPAFLIVGFAALALGWYWGRRISSGQKKTQESLPVKNPLELSAAFIFAVIFVGLLAATHYTLQQFGRGGVYALSAITGTVDVDPFALGIAQSGQPAMLAARTIVIAASSNNLMKGVYALCFGDRQTGTRSLLLLTGLAVAGLAPLLFL